MAKFQVGETVYLDSDNVIILDLYYANPGDFDLTARVECVTPGLPYTGYTDTVPAAILSLDPSATSYYDWCDATPPVSTEATCLFAAGDIAYDPIEREDVTVIWVQRCQDGRYGLKVQYDNGNVNFPYQDELEQIF